MAGLPPLPPGFTYATPPTPPPYAEPLPAQPDPPVRSGPPMSGPITTVTSAADTTVTIHRCDYELTDHLGEYTVHGYAWRCTRCRALSAGYQPYDFADCLTDARTHTCQEPTRV